MVIKMRRCITVTYFREVESKREIHNHNHNHNQRTLYILIISLETQEYLYSTFLRRLCKATRFSTGTASHILVFCRTIAGTTSLQIY